MGRDLVDVEHIKRKWKAKLCLDVLGASPCESATATASLAYLP